MVIVKAELRFLPTIPQQYRHSHRLAEPPETTASTIRVISLNNPSGVSSQASQPQLGNGAVRQEPNLTCSPGNLEKATTIGAACGSCGVSLMGGRARLSLPSSSSAWRPSSRSTANSRSSRSSNSVAASCRGWKRSGLVTREYASSGGPSIPHLPPRMSSPPRRGYRHSPSWQALSSWLSSPHCVAPVYYGGYLTPQRGV